MEGNHVYLSTIRPRVFLLEALYFKVEELHSELAGQNKWASFSSGLVAALEAMSAKVLQELPQDTELRTAVKHLLEKKHSTAVFLEKTSDDIPSVTAVAVSTALASFVQAFDEHLVAFLNKDAYVSAVVCLVSGSEFLRSVSSSWGKFLDTYDRTIVPARQEWGFLTAGLVLSQDLIIRLRATKPNLSPQVVDAYVRTDTDFVFWAGQRPGEPFETANNTLEGDGSLEELWYGKAEMAFPSDATIPTPLDDIKPLGLESMGHSYTKFIQSVNSHLASLDKQAGSSSPTTDVLLFVHGFSTRFGPGDIAAVAQLKHDMRLFGTSIAYCWPSQGELTIDGYWKDEKAVDATIPYLASFIKLCITQVKARRLHILAHSLGNRAMIGALHQIFTEIISSGDNEWIQTGLPLKNVISSAADWTVSEFQAMVDEAKNIFITANKYRPHFSVYCSDDDNALELSTIDHWGIFRLGLTRAHFQKGVVTLSEPPETGFIDVIDATGFPNSIHMYFAREKRVLEDTQHLISTPGKERAYLRASDGSGLINNVAHVVDNKTFEFYCFNPGEWPSQS